MDEERKMILALFAREQYSVNQLITMGDLWDELYDEFKGLTPAEQAFYTCKIETAKPEK